MYIFMPPFEEERAYCFAHVGRSVRLYSFSFRSIIRECLHQPSSNFAHTSILGSRGTLLFLGSLGQRSMSPGSNVPKPFLISNSRKPLPTLIKLGPLIHPGWRRNPIDFVVIRSNVKYTRVKCAKTV